MKKFIQHKVILLPYAKKSQSQQGFTLIEALATLLVGSITVSAALAGFASLRQFTGNDQQVANINQRLRTTFSTIGPDIQQTGEGLISDPKLQALTIGVDNTNSSIVTVLKSYQVSQLSLCDNITKSTTAQPLVVSAKDPSNIANDHPDVSCHVKDEEEVIEIVNGTVQEEPKLIHDGWPDNVKQWQNKRIANASQPIQAFIYDKSNGKNEFFPYKGEITQNELGIALTPVAENDEVTPVIPAITPSIVKLDTNIHIWQNDYNKDSTVIYLVEKRQYKVENNVLKLIVNDNLAQPFDLVEDIDRLEVVATVQSLEGGQEYECTVIPPTEDKHCDPVYPSPGTFTWNQVKFVDVKVVAREASDKGNQARGLTDDDLSLNQTFFPRNRLSF